MASVTRADAASTQTSNSRATPAVGAAPRRYSNPEPPLSPAQIAKICGDARRLGLEHPEQDLQALVKMLFPDVDRLESVGAHAQCDRLLRALPGYAVAFLAGRRSPGGSCGNAASRAAGRSGSREYTVEALFQDVRFHRDPEGSWEHAALSFLVRADSAAKAGVIELGPFIRDALDSDRLPLDFRDELRRQEGSA